MKTSLIIAGVIIGLFSVLIIGKNSLIQAGHPPASIQSSSPICEPDGSYSRTFKWSAVFPHDAQFLDIRHAGDSNFLGINVTGNGGAITLPNLDEGIAHEWRINTLQGDHWADTQWYWFPAQTCDTYAYPYPTPYGYPYPTPYGYPYPTPYGYPYPTPAQVTVTPATLETPIQSSCTTDNLVPVTFGWNRASASDGSPIAEEWLDLDLVNDTFAPGDFAGTNVKSTNGTYQTNLTPNLQIWWRVNTHIAGDWHPSATGSFRTNPCGPTSPPPAPQGLGHTIDIACASGSSYSLTVYWNSVAGATGYKVQLAVNGSLAPPNDIGNFTSATVNNAQPDANYTWWVWAYNSVGDSTHSQGPDWSVPSCTPPPPPVGGSPPPPPPPPPPGSPVSNLRTYAPPACADGPYSLGLEWDGTSSVLWLDIDDDLGFGSYSNKEVGNQTFTGAPAGFDPSIQLLPDTNYYWRLWYAQESTWAYPEPRFFNIPKCGAPSPPPPSPSPPAGGPSQTVIKPVAQAIGAFDTTCDQQGGTWTVTFRWTPGKVIDAGTGETIATPSEQWVDLKIGAGAFEAGNFLNAGPLAGTDQSYTWSGIKPVEYHLWRVANFFPGDTNPYHSEPIGFSLAACGAPPSPPPPPPAECTNPAAFDLTGPKDTLFIPTPGFSWTASSGHTQYFIDLTDDNFQTWWYVAVAPSETTFAWPTWTGTEFAGGKTPPNSGLVPGVEYKWKMSAMNACVDGNKFIPSNQTFNIKYDPGAPPPPAGQVFPAYDLFVGPTTNSLVGVYNEVKSIVEGTFSWKFDSRNQNLLNVFQLVYLKHNDDNQNPTRTNSLHIGPFDPNVTSFTTTEPPGLTPNQKHTWTVDTCTDFDCTNHTIATNADYEFTTIDRPVGEPPPPPPAPGQPELPDPPASLASQPPQEVDLAKVNNITFSWEDPKGNATNFWLDVSRDNGFSNWWGCNARGITIGWINCDWLEFAPDPAGGAILIGDPDLPLTSLENGTYHWRVAAVNDAGFSAPSVSRDFTIINSPAGGSPPPVGGPPPVSCTTSSPFVLVNPPPVVDSNSPAFDWEDKDAVSWFFDFTDQAGRDSGKWWYVKVNTNHLSALPSMYADRYDGVQAPQVLEPNKTYYWKVTALSGCANDKFNSGDSTWVNYLTPSNGSFNAWRSVTYPLAAPIPPPVTVTPASLVSANQKECSADGRTRKIEFNWTPASVSNGNPIESQWLDVSLLDNNFAPQTFISSNNPPFVGQGSYTTGTGTIPDLEVNKKYYWRINSFYQDWHPSPSRGEFIVTACPPPPETPKEFRMSFTQTEQTVEKGSSIDYNLRFTYDPGWDQPLVLLPATGSLIYEGIRINYEENTNVVQIGDPEVIVKIETTDQAKASTDPYGFTVQACTVDNKVCRTAISSVKVVEPQSPIPPLPNVEKASDKDSIRKAAIARGVGKLDGFSGYPLDRVLLGLLDGESGGGNHNAVGPGGEIGVFQYFAQIWDGYGLAWVDSGSGTSPGYNNPGWKTPGKDSTDYENYFRNHPNPAARPPHVDANAWDPYNQIEATAGWLESNTSSQVCTRWTPYPAQISIIQKQLGYLPKNRCSQAQNLNNHPYLSAIIDSIVQPAYAQSQTFGKSATNKNIFQKIIDSVDSFFADLANKITGADVRQISSPALRPISPDLGQCLLPEGCSSPTLTPTPTPTSSPFVCSVNPNARTPQECLNSLPTSAPTPTTSPASEKKKSFLQKVIETITKPINKARGKREYKYVDYHPAGYADTRNKVLPFLPYYKDGARLEYLIKADQFLGTIVDPQTPDEYRSKKKAIEDYLRANTSTNLCDLVIFWTGPKPILNKLSVEDSITTGCAK